MAVAGCVYAIHLDMNPGHCAFSFNKIESVKPLVAEGEPLDPRMKINPNRFVRWSPKDFFYLTLRNGLPQNDPLLHWQIAPGQGPHPTAIPAIFVGEKRIGELLIELDRVDTSRLRFHLIPGSAELSPSSNPHEGNPGAALIAWGLGHRTHGTRAGLTLGENIIAPVHRNYASLLIQSGKLLLEPPGNLQSAEGETQIVQLPALAREGALLPEAYELGGNRKRGALCLDSRGALLIARMTHDTSAPLAQALVDLGCTLVVDMDRGSHSPARVERAGTSEPPYSGYEQTMLYGLSAPMKPLTHLF